MADEADIYSNTNSRVRITIPGFHHIQNDIGKAYTVYRIVIAKPGGQKEIEKRYSEFYMLNKTLKENHCLPQGQGISFPPKTFNISTAVKEERRKKLEKYLQILCAQDPIATEVLSFLGISQPHLMDNEYSMYSSCEDLLTLSTNNSKHQPILGFLSDPFVVDEHDSKQAGDVLLEGILDGLYYDNTYM